MTPRVEMFHCSVGSCFVVDGHRANGTGLELTSDEGGRNSAFLQITEQVDVEEEPVGNDYEAFHAALKQHFEVAFEPRTLVMSVGEDRQVTHLVESVLGFTQDQRAVRVCHVEDGEADGLAAFAAEGTCKLIRSVAKFPGGALDAFLGGSRKIARQRRFV